jgi:cytochrome P450
MKNPDKLAKAHAEIDAAFAAGNLSSPVKYSETTTKLPFVCASIKEAMRMHPSVGFNMQRHAPEEGIELAGKFIPKGYRIGLNPAVVQYDKDVYGQDADEFRPERWLVSDDEWRAMDKHMLIFGAGTRTCIGKNVSFLVVKLVGIRMTDVCRSPWLSCTRSYPSCCGILSSRWPMTDLGRQSIDGFTSKRTSLLR